MSNKGNLVVISAASGTGKTTLITRALKEIPGLKFSVSHTTRQPRENERPNEDYVFISEKEFQDMIRCGDFLEWAMVHGHYYGTSRSAVLSEREAGNDVLLDIDVQGAMQVVRSHPDAVMIFLLAPSYEVLRSRLERRGLDEAPVVEARLKTAKSEIAQYRGYQYVIINEDVEAALLELKSIVLSARCRMERRADEAEKILSTFP